MFKAILAARWYLLLGFFVFTLTLALTTPLHFVWRFAQPYAANLPVKIQQVSGTIWDGQLQINERQLGLLQVQWQLDQWQLLTAQAQLAVRVAGDGLQLEGSAVIDADQVLVIRQADGFLSSKHLGPLLRRGKASLNGEFELSGLNARIDIPTKQISDLEGQVLFTGGDVGFPVNGKPIQATLPLLVGQLARNGDKSSLDIRTQEGLDIGQAFLQNDGWGGVAIRRRFLDILGQQWPAEATEETVIFEVSQKIL